MQSVHFVATIGVVSKKEYEVIGLKKLFSRSQSTSFLRRLYASLIALGLVSIILVSTFLLASYYRSARTLADRFFQNLLLQTNYSITYMNDLAERLSSSLTYNQEVIRFLNLKQEDSLQTSATHRAVRSVTLPLTYVDSVYLYNKELDLMLDTKTGVQSSLEDFYDQDTAQQISSFDAYVDRFVPFVHTTRYGGKTDSIYTYILPDLGRDGSLTAACIINIRMDVLMDSLQELNAYNSQVKFVVADPQGTLLSRSPFPEAEDAQSLTQLLSQIAASGQPTGNKTVDIGGKNWVLAFTNGNSNGWYLLGMMPSAFLLRDVISNTLICLGFLVLLSGVCVFIAQKLAQRLNRPVEVVTQIAKGETPLPDAQPLAQEFQYLASVLNQMQTEKKEYARYVHRTKDLVRTEFLKSFFTGMTVYTPEQAKPKLNQLGCGWILSSPLRMCLFSIDNYAHFAQNNNPRERWALRFAVMNVATELLEKNFDCELVQSSSRQFVAILNCEEKEGADRSAPALESTLGEILSFIHDNFGFTLTAAYGTVFRSISHLPRMYENMEELLLLRLRHGSGRVLNPHMAEDLNLDDFQVSSAAESALVSSVLNGSEAQAIGQFESIAKELFRYSYSEILPYLLHLSYRLFHCAKETGAGFKPQVAESFQKVSTRLPQCETEQDFRECCVTYLQELCEILAAQKNAPSAQSSNLIIQRVIKIIETSYPQKELCLSSIADELGLSAHYIGQVFRSAQNKSVAKYIMDLRLEKIAQALRESNRSFAQIMEDVGLDPEQKNYIYTCFKKRFGVTVKNYRLEFSSQSE